LVAVTGPVGAGKSALARAILGLYPLESGCILINAKLLSEVPAAERAAQSGYLPQDPYLFSGSVRDNIRFGASLAEPTLERAVTAAALAEDVRGFPAGLDTEIGELGLRVSGGQRQRIALARALVGSGQTVPGLLVLDDPFSAVDVDTEARLIAALRETFGPNAPADQRATIVLCSHRLAAFPQADRVVVLEAGRVADEGTHGELLERGGLYARIYRAQSRVEKKD
jgi:ATP-binding cassette subfamily B protein